MTKNIKEYPEWQELKEMINRFKTEVKDPIVRMEHDITENRNNFNNDLFLAYCSTQEDLTDLYRECKKTLVKKLRREGGKGYPYSLTAIFASELEVYFEARKKIENFLRGNEE